jgi:hypothetical protein
MSEQQTEDKNTAPSFFQMVISTLFAFIGVAKNERRERDFAHGNPKVFIIVGLILAIVFVLVISTVVSIILP